MLSSSSAESPPTALRYTNNLSGRVAKRTYGRRVAVHKEKRKAEAQLSSDDSASERDDEEKRKRLMAKDNPPPPKKRNSGLEKGRGGGTVTKVASVLPSSSTPRFTIPLSSSPLSSPPPSRSPSPTPSPHVQRVALSPGTHPAPSSSLTRSRFQSRAAPKRSIPAPEVNIHAPTSPTVHLLSHSQSPSTPSRPPVSNRHRSHTPRPTPKDLSSLFAAISPQANSPGSSAGEESAGGSRPGGRPSGLRRMLTKTQSLGVVPLTPSNKGSDDGPPSSPFGSGMAAFDPTTPSRGAMRKTQSMPESPIKSSPRGSDRGVGTVVQPVQEQSGSGGRAKRTYGKVRTMLVEVSQAGEGRGSGVLGGDTDDDDSMPQASYAELRRRYEVDNTIDPSGSGSGTLLAELLQAKAPQTVSDMRSRGENRRFTDQLGYLVEGMTDSSASMAFKRSSAIDVLQNMQKESWMSKLLICGQVDRVWDCFHSTSGDDDVIEAACLLFLVLLLEHGSGLEQVVQTHPEDCTSLVISSLKRRDGPLDRSSKIKPSNAVQRLRAVSARLNMGWTEDEECNTRRIASTILRQLSRDTLWVFTGGFIKEGMVLEKTLKSLSTEVRNLAERFRLYEKGLDMLPADFNIDFCHIHSCLQIIPSIMATSLEGREMLIEHHRDTVQDFINTAIVSTNLALLTDGKRSVQASRCSIHTVQLLANLANMSPEWAVAIIKADGSLTCLTRLVLQRDIIIPSAGRRTIRDGSVGSTGTEMDEEEVGKENELADAKEMSEQEFLCLLLALLTTAALTGKDTAKAIALTKLAPDCLGEHECLRGCRCLSAMTVGQHLAELYAVHVSEEDDPLSSILTGYLALLLSKLTGVASTQTLELIITCLPGSTRPAKLKGLLASLRELNDLQSMMRNTIKDILPPGTSSEEVGVGASMVEDEADVVEDAIRELEALVS